MRKNRIIHRLVKQSKCLAGQKEIDFLNNMLQQMAAAQDEADEAWNKLVELHDSNEFADVPFEGLLKYKDAAEVTSNFTDTILTRVMGTYNYGGSDEELDAIERLIKLTENFKNKVENLYHTWTSLGEKAESIGLYEKFWPIEDE